MKSFIYTFLVIFLFFSSCAPDKSGSSHGSEKSPKIAKMLSPSNNSIVKKGDPIKIELQITDKNKELIDSIGSFLDDSYSGKIDAELLTIDIETANLKVGRRKLIVKIYKKDGSQENKLAQLKVLPKNKPKQYGFKLVNEFPHNKTSYTQGLAFHNGYLYEGTGQRGLSKLMKIDLENGETLQENDLPNNYFGEGIAILNNRIFQLTWTANQGFIYDLETLKPIGNFSYTGEGWGLTTDGKHLIMSNGSNELVFLNPDNFKVDKKLEVMDNKGAITKLNELEYVNGEIWANYYEYNKFIIYRIDPNTGELLGVIDLLGIVKAADNHAALDVLNGIAYDQQNDRIFVTGKNYPKVYEIDVYRIGISE